MRKIEKRPLPASAVEKPSQSESIKTEIKTLKSLAGGIIETIKFKCLTFQISEKLFSRRIHCKLSY